MKNNKSIVKFHFTFGQIVYWSERVNEANFNPIRTGLFESVQVVGGGGIFSTNPRKI